MGVFSVKIKVGVMENSHPHFVDELDAVVDNGSQFTTLPERLFAKYHLPILGEMPTKLADGSIVKRKYGVAVIELEGKVVPAMVYIGSDNGPVLVGADSLERACLGIDPVNQRLFPIEAIQY